MGYAVSVRLEGVDRDLISRSEGHDFGEDLRLSDYPIGAEVDLEDWARQQDCIFRRAADRWEQRYAATWG